MKAKNIKRFRRLEETIEAQQREIVELRKQLFECKESRSVPAFRALLGERK